MGVKQALRIRLIGIRFIPDLLLISTGYSPPRRAFGDLNLTKIWRPLAWLAAAALTFVTLSPPSLRPLTAVPHDFEHLVAFGITGALFAAAYPRHRGRLIVLALAAVALLELAQIAVPGRHARMIDFMTDFAGTAAGIVIVAALQQSASNAAERLAKIRR
jgi:VanZ family protein